MKLHDAHASFLHSRGISEQKHIACVGRWVQDAGGCVLEGAMVEVSPLVSYSGEDLAARCTGVDYGPDVAQVA